MLLARRGRPRSAPGVHPPLRGAAALHRHDAAAAPEVLGAPLPEGFRRPRRSSPSSTTSSAHAGGRLLGVAWEYVSFIVFIGSLFIVAGGIHVRTRGEATPFHNVLFLLGGAVLANLVGTTGASMLLIRPWIRLNKYRYTHLHTAFFIFIISNVGGCLTPIGDPPLFLGYLKGVPFWWVTARCLPAWTLAVGALCAIFYALDRVNFLRAPRPVREAADRARNVEDRGPAQSRLAGAHPGRRLSETSARPARSCSWRGGAVGSYSPRRAGRSTRRITFQLRPDQGGRLALRRHLRHHGARRSTTSKGTPPRSGITRRCISTGSAARSPACSTTRPTYLTFLTAAFGLDVAPDRPSGARRRLPRSSTPPTSSPSRSAASSSAR